MSDTTMSLGSAFPVITFDKLPSGMEKSRGRIGRSKYDWGSLKVKQGIVVPGDKYSSAQSSATGFAANHPYDEEQEKKLELHMRGRLTSALKAFKKEVEENGVEITNESGETVLVKEWSDDLWTEERKAAVTPDPDFVKANTRMFSSQAVRDEHGRPIKTKGFKNGMADEYYIIRTQ